MQLCMAPDRLWKDLSLPARASLSVAFCISGALETVSGAPDWAPGLPEQTQLCTSSPLGAATPALGGSRVLGTLTAHLSPKRPVVPKPSALKHLFGKRYFLVFSVKMEPPTSLQFMP